MAQESEKDPNLVTVIDMVPLQSSSLDDQNNMGPLPSSYQDLYAVNLSMSPNASIFRTPKILFRHNEQAYTPNAFSIGPFHYGSKQLEPTQKIKLKYLRGLLSRSQTPEALYRQLIETIKSVQGQARECYAGPIKRSVEEKLVEILVLDGCFILELLRKDADKVTKDTDDPIFAMSCLQEFLSHDLILLENQIPWLVLEHLFSLTKIAEDDSLIQHVLDFFANIFSSEKPDIKPEEFRRPDIQIKHILDLLRYSLIVRLPRLNEKEKTGWEPFPSATKINEAGIELEKVRAQDALSILDIKFEKGALMIPALLIQETTETIFRNLISFEQCCPNYDSIVTSYAKLMDNLIDTDRDVEILCENDILDNWLNPEDVKKFFNSMYTDAYVKKFYYHKICQQVNKHRKRWWPRWRFFYVHNYFSTPWAIVSQVVGTILLVLTVLQTVYAILSFVKDNNC